MEVVNKYFIPKRGNKMKLHLCYFNYTKWSDPIMGYGLVLEQYRVCKICNKVNRKRHTSFNLSDNLQEVLKSINNVRTKDE